MASPGASLAASPDFPFVQPRFENIGDAKSIPEGTVTALAQDARGMIWIGTQKGLISYDGYRFRRFAHEADNPASLAGDFVIAVWAASDGRIWVGSTSDGLSVFDPGSNRFTHFKPDPNRSDSLADSRVSALAGDAKGGLWIATNQGLDYLPPGSTGVRHLRHESGNPNSLMDDHVRSLLLDRQGRLWVGSASGLQRMDRDGKNFEPVAGSNATSSSSSSSTSSSTSSSSPALDAINVQTLFEAQDGKIWIGTQKHGAAWLVPGSASTFPVTPALHWLALGTGATGSGRAVGFNAVTRNLGSTEKSGQPDPPNTLAHPWVTGMAQIGADQIWVASYGGGISLVSADDGRILQQLRHDPALPGSLALDLVKPLLVDRAGFLWIGTWGGGLQRFNSKNRMVRLLRYSQTLPTGLSHPDVRSVLELANGQILIGSNGNGIDIFDRKQGRVGGYRAGLAGALPDASVLAMAQTPDGTLWAGTRQAGVVRMLPGSQSWQTIPGLPSPQVRRLLSAQDGSVWAATDRGVARWRANPAEEPAEAGHFELIADDNGKPMQSTIFTLAEDAQGRIWAGSDNGLWVVEPGASVLYGIHPEPGRANSLISGFVNSLLIDRNGRLWLATDKGLERLQQWDGKVAGFEHVSALLGRAGQALNGNLLEDKSGRIWSELAVIDPAKMSMAALAKADGMDVGTSTGGTYGQTRDGLLFFGGTQGVAMIDPALFQPWDYLPPVVVTELKINGKPAPLGELALPRANRGGNTPVLPLPLILTPDQRNFAIEFAALDYSETDKNRYQYRLQGYDNDWIDTDAEHRSAAYGNLRPGNYTLQVRGSNRLGIWSPDELAISLQVQAAYWQTRWFYTLAVLALCSAGYAIYRWRTMRLKMLVAARTADILKLGKIGQELTSTLDTEQAFGRVYKQVSARLDARVFNIGMVDAVAGQIVFVYAIENAQRQPVKNLCMNQHDWPAVWCVREQRELIATSRTGLLRYVNTLLPPDAGAMTGTETAVGTQTGTQPGPQAWSAMETVVYLPLIVEQRVIGCLSVQSLQPNAYDKDQLEFLRVLASYTAIALSNSTAHGDLAAAHRHLQETQSQLIQSEKMASLGQLVANVAHEINTPIGAVKASSSNISDALERALVAMPKVLKLLSPADEQVFKELITCAATSTEVFTSREERIAKRDISKELTQAGVGNTNQKADILVQLHAHHTLPGIMPLLYHPQADLILDTANDVAAIINNTSNINLAIARISKIVFALNTFAQTGGNGQRMQADLEQGLETVLTLYQTQLKNGIQLVREFETIPPISCLPDELNQVWINLIHNALQAMAGSGTLTLGISCREHHAIVSFKDTGSGIPEAIRPRIFDAFFTTRPTGEGSGLGLAIVKKIISRHQGRIEVASEMGAGTTFLVYLPYAAAAT